MYVLFALCLGVSWYLILNIFESFQSILKDQERAISVVLFMITSVTLAVSFHEKIGSASTWSQHIALGASLPYIGTVVFSILWSVSHGLQDPESRIEWKHP